MSPVNEPKVWFVFNKRLSMWRVDGKERAYSTNMFEAKLYTEEQADKFAEATSDEIKVPLEDYRKEIENLYHTLNPHDYISTHTE